MFNFDRDQVEDLGLLACRSEAQIPLIGDADIEQISADFERGRFETGSAFQWFPAFPAAPVRAYYADTVAVTA